MNVSVYEEKTTESLSSMEKDPPIIPMSILDDLEVCEVRAKLRMKLGKGGATPSTKEGKESHKKLDALAGELLAGLEQRGFQVLDAAVERLIVSLWWRREAVLLGAPDIVVFSSTPCRGFVIINAEYATYASAPETVKHRQALYSVALYRLYGFPVVPVLLVEKPGARIYAQILWRGPGWDRELGSRIMKIVSIAYGGEEKPPRSREVCASCPPRLRGLCPLRGG